MLIGDCSSPFVQSLFDYFLLWYPREFTDPTISKMTTIAKVLIYQQDE